MQAQAYQVPSNKSAPTPPEAPKLSEIKLIDYDFAKYGSSDERKRLLAVGHGNRRAGAIGKQAPDGSRHRCRERGMRE